MKNLKRFILFLLIISFPIFSFSQNEGIDTLTTIGSFESVGNFYCMDYTGDYNELLNMMDDLMTGNSSSTFDSFECSLFSANGNENYQIFGRNFDNPENDVLLTRYSPPDAYKSLAFTRLNDCGYQNGTNFNNLTLSQKLPLLYAAYFVPDGINEFGLSCGLASVSSVQVSIDPLKDTIFVTRLIREILDHAKTVEEALQIANNYNVFDNGINTISHHVLVGTPDGESLILEYHNGAFHAVNTNEYWQVLTNIPVYNVPHQQLMNTCWRYNSLYNDLEDAGGSFSWDEGMNALEAVHMNCPWSAIYEMTNRAVYIAVHNNYDDIAYVNLEDFEFMIYVDVPKVSFEENESQIFNSPNPFNGSTSIHYSLPVKSIIQINIYDSMGRMVIELINEEKKKGHYSVNWDATDMSGNKVETGIYFCKLSCENYSEAIRMIVFK